MNTLLLLPAYAGSLINRIAPKKDKTKQIAAIIAHYSNKRAKDVKKELQTQKAQLVLGNKELKKAQQHVEKIRSSNKYLESTYSKLSLKKPRLVEAYKDVIGKLMKTNNVDEFAVDSHKRILVTTKPLKIKKLTWTRARTAGAYQIRIDLSKETFREGIEILNITKAYNEYQSPTISGTECCWGNIATDIDFEFKTNDIYQLVLDLIDYIQSPIDNAGYIHMPGQGKDTGWEQFFSRAVKRPLGYCFRVHERKRHTPNNTISDYIRAVPDDTDSLPSMSWTSGTITMGGTSTAATASYTTSYINGGLAQSYEHLAIRRPRLTEWQDDVLRALVTLGFTEAAAYHYLPMVAPEGGLFCHELHLRMREEGIAYMIVYRVDPDRERAEMDRMVRHGSYDMTLQNTIGTSTRETYAVNRADFVQGRWEEIGRGGSFRFNVRRYEREQYQRDRSAWRQVNSEAELAWRHDAGLRSVNDHRTIDNSPTNQNTLGIARNAPTNSQLGGSGGGGGRLTAMGGGGASGDTGIHMVEQVARDTLLSLIGDDNT